MSQTDPKNPDAPQAAYGSKKNAFGVLVAPNAPGCSTASGSPTGKFDADENDAELRVAAQRDAGIFIACLRGSSKEIALSRRACLW